MIRTLTLLALVALTCLLTMFVMQYLSASKARIARRHACINNLRSIAEAKAKWALENKKSTGESCTESEVNAAARLKPVCPSGGRYSYNPVGKNPTCSLSAQGHRLK